MSGSRLRRQRSVERSDVTGQKTAIDSWYEEIHYLVKEDGKWRIRGNAGERPRALQFGTAPHPLF